MPRAEDYIVDQTRMGWLNRRRKDLVDTINSCNDVLDSGPDATGHMALELPTVFQNIRYASKELEYVMKLIEENYS